MEQVCRALAVVCRNWLRYQRGTTERVCAAEIIGYHQERNRAAATSRKKRRPLVRTRKKPRRRKPQRKPRSTVRSK